MSKHKQLRRFNLTRFFAIAGLVAVASCVGTALYGANQPEASAYDPYCTSTACRAAADAAADAASKAEAASAAADSLQGALDSMSAQIAELEAQIEANKAMIEDLELKIFETQTELNNQRAALAELLVAQYHSTSSSGNSSAIDVLATSSSISDLADEATRQTSAEEQITKTARAMNATKLDLEQQQASVEATLADNEAKNEEIADIYAEQANLQAQYQGQADAYSEYASEQRAIMLDEMNKAAAEAARLDRSGISGTGASGWWGTNTYPYAKGCPGINLDFGFSGGYVCQCTSYAGWKVSEKYGITISSWGNANRWNETAERLGYTVSNTPAAGTVAQSDAGAYGHVAWVESVNSDGTINITEYNRNDGTCRSGDFCARTGVNASQYRYIYFR